MADDPAFIWDQRTPRPKQRSRPRREPETDAAALGDRISLREAEHRFGVSVGRLRSWARSGSIDAVMASGVYGKQWMVTPESIAHHLSRSAVHTSPPSAPSGRRTGPTDDGSAMLVPRDAWDRLMDQLGNLHEAGLQLAEARERAAKAETEATFLRERLSEIRQERDELKEVRADPGPRSTPTPVWESVRKGVSRLFGRR